MKKKVLILGKGKSGRAVSELLYRLGYDPVLWDENDSAEILNENYSFIVKSPGIPPSKSYLNSLNDKLVSELDIALLNSKGYKIGITGTNGKSTTTLITYLLFKNLKNFYPHLKTFIGGNFGNPFSQFAFYTDENSISILELSSFQLHDSKYLNFDSGAILNISEDHISWHKTLKDYMYSKLKLILNSKIKIMHYNAYLKYKIAFKDVLNNKNIITFGNPKRSPYYILNNKLVTPNIEIDLSNFNDFSVIPFAMDLLAALCIFENFVRAILNLNLDDFYSLDFIKKALEKYKNLPFRLEKRKIGNIVIYNDSKSTNPHSVEWALRALDNKIVLIMGGKDKGLCFRNLAPLIKDKVIAIYLFGEAKHSIYNQLKNIANVKICTSLEEALREALSLAKEKNINILFSPGCSSFDRFKNYLDRGKYFDKLLENYKHILEEKCVE